MHRALLALASFAVCLLLTPPARAYILSTDFLMRIIAEGRRDNGAKDVTFTLNAEVAGHDHPLDERLYLKRPERYRLVQQNDTSHIFVEREGQAAEGEDRVVHAVPGGSSNLLPLLYFPRGKDLDDMQARMIHGLQAVGIDTGVTSLARINDNTAFVIGAHSWETTRPQLWLDKTTFQPIRFIVPCKSGDKTSLCETRLLEYGSGPAGPAFPRVIENYLDGKLVRHAEVTAAQFNQDLPETLFELGGHHRGT